MKNVKKTYLHLLVIVIASLFVWFTNPTTDQNKHTDLSKPLVHETEGFSPQKGIRSQESIDKEKRKNRKWSKEEAAQYQKAFLKVKKSIASQKSSNRSVEGFANGNLFGEWKSMGPYNMPGAFQFCEMDEGTDTVYAVTCGHYGGVQFIWKGTLWDDNWTVITPKDPSRFEDLMVIPNGNTRRIIAGHEQGQIMYSDNSGQTWTYSSGLPEAIHSTIVNRQDNFTVYATDGQSVYISTNKGTSFTEYQNLGSSSNNSRLYSPRWDAQPGSGCVYLAIGNTFYKKELNEDSFTQTGTIATNGRIGIAGDNTKLWITLNNNTWYSSTNNGTSFSYQPTTNCWYGDLSDNMSAGQYPAVNPENTDNLIGGYAIPGITLDGGATTNYDATNYWGYYQNSVGNDPKVRTNFHPDFQAHQFFYDVNGDLITLRSSDGGIFISYTDFLQTSFPSYASMTDVYYDISLLGKPTQETYRGGFMYGANHINDMTTGTQDQGWQNTRLNSYDNEMLSWDQVGGGDGPCCITGDGLIGWKYNYFGDAGFKRIQLYNGDTYMGLNGPASAEFDFSFTGGSYFTPSVGDWDDGNRIWVLSETLRRMEYSTSSSQITALEHNLTGTSHYIQGVAQSQVDPDMVYAMQNGYVFKSTDRGTNWSSIANQTATGISGSSQNSGMGWSSPNNSDIVLFATESGTSVKSIFSEDGGITWTNVTGSGENSFPSAQVNGMAGNEAGTMVFASTNMGPYVFIIDEQLWYPMATDETTPLFWGHIVYCVTFGEQELVRFSSWGQGIWDFNISVALAPTANFETNTESSCSGVVQFSDLSDYASEWSWDFGDEETSTEQNPEHIYSSDGTYTVSLTVSNYIGEHTVIKTDYITTTIVEAPIVIGANICAGSIANLSASGTSTLNWYENETDEVPIFTGTDFETPILFENTTYYVENSESTNCSSALVPVTVVVENIPVTPGISSSNDVLYANLVSGRYIRLKALSEVNGGAWASAAEFRITGLDQSTWSLVYTDSEETSGEDGAAANTFDNNESTIWHTVWSAGTDPYPHEIQIDLGDVYHFNEFSYLPRQNGINGTIADYEFFVSNDPNEWSTAAASGTWENSNTEKFIDLSQTYDNYQWYVDGTIIDGATQASFTPSQTGNYTVVTSNSNCSSESAPFWFDYILSVSENNKPIDFSLYPNPCQEKISVLSTESITRIRIYNTQGVELINKQTKEKEQLNSIELNTNQLASGVYYFLIETANNKSLKKVVKL